MLNNEIHCPGHRSVVKDFLFFGGDGGGGLIWPYEIISRASMEICTLNTNIIHCLICITIFFFIFMYTVSDFFFVAF